MSLYSVQAVLILDSDGGRLLAKYYAPPHGEAGTAPTGAPTSLAAQRKFEKSLVAKTNRRNGDIVIVDGHLVVYKQATDALIYIVASVEENESLVFQALLGLRDAIDILLDHSVDKESLLVHYSRVVLAVDETVDSGIILESDAQVISSRVTRRVSELDLNNVDLETGIKSVFNFAKGKLSQAVRQQFA